MQHMHRTCCCVHLDLVQHQVSIRSTDCRDPISKKTVESILSPKIKRVGRRATVTYEWRGGLLSGWCGGPCCPAIRMVWGPCCPAIRMAHVVLLSGWCGGPCCPAIRMVWGPCCPAIRMVWRPMLSCYQDGPCCPAIRMVWRPMLSCYQDCVGADVVLLSQVEGTILTS